MLKFPSSGRVPFIFAQLSSSNIKMSHRICHGKPKSGVWAYFDEVSEEGSKRVRCLLCPQDKKPWISVPNATRMAKHLAEEHKTSVNRKSTSLRVHHLTCKSSWITCSAGVSSSVFHLLLADPLKERVFSAADWATDNRERLGFAKLACEVFLRFNLLWLNASPMLQG